MTDVSKPLPEFENPPVVEVALSVQFETLANLRTPQLGLLWQEFRDRFPVTEEHPPLDAVFERFGVPAMVREGVRFQMLPAPPVPRCWFLNKEGTELVQVQQDRFIHNWRKVGDKDRQPTPYPRYDSVRRTFENELVKFRDFLSRNNIGDLAPNQCEVTYVNHIESGECWTNHGQLGELLSVFSPRYTDEFLAVPEDGRMSVRYLIPTSTGEPLGRLHISVEPAYRASDDAPMFLLTLTARGRPASDGIPGVLGFLDIGREWVVRGFTSITTETMHKSWGRKR